MKSKNYLLVCTYSSHILAVISGHKSWVKLKSYERIKASLFDDKFKLVTNIIFTV